MFCPMSDCRRGFTLIDVMVALVIVAVLTVIAYPSYQESIRKGKRTEGRAALAQLMQQQELYYSSHNSYRKFSFASTDSEERKFRWFSGGSPKRSAYEIKAEACENDTIQNCVVLIAMPGTVNVDSNFTDPTCGELQLNSAGVKTPNNTDCWK